MQTFISRMLSLLPPFVVLSLLVDVRPVLAVYRYKQEWLGPLYLATFKLFGGVMAVVIILAYLCTRKNPLIKAIEDQDIYRIERIIRRKPKSVNQVIDLSIGSTTPLLSAIFADMKTGNSFDATELLIDHGADVNLTDKSGWSPLFMAVKRGNERLVQLLLKNGANPSYIVPHKKYDPDSGKTPLDMARNARCDKIVELLLNYQGASK